MTNEMILIVDSGSTKCLWMAVKSGNGEAVGSAKEVSQPMTYATNPAQTTTLQPTLRKTYATYTLEEVRTLGINAIQQTEEQITEILATLPPWESVDKVYFYGAGCGAQFGEATLRLKQVLEDHFHPQEITIESDLTATARALFGTGEGIACILGTGSNSCHCLGGQIVANTPPLGYILGDEGSGAVLGRKLINAIFKGHIDLKAELLEALGMSYEQLIHRIYREERANRFLASLAPFIHQHLSHPHVEELVVESFCEFIRKNLHAYPANLDVGFVGGVAAHFEAQLRTALHKEGYTLGKIMESPAAGLLSYHLHHE